MDWVHCNNCGNKPKQVKIFLSSCGHLFCDSCVQRANTSNESQCFVCKKKFQVTEVCAKMRQDMMVLFRDPREYAVTLMKELHNILSFQEKNRSAILKAVNEASITANEKAIKIKEDQQKAAKDFGSAKSELSETFEGLKVVKLKKKELIAKIEQLKQKRAALEARISLNNEKTDVRRSKTEPPPKKVSKCNPPAKDDFFDKDAGSLDETSPSIVTSTPIANIDASRREYMAKMFGTGNLHPSPICRQ